MIPIAHHPTIGACAMIPLQEPQALFGAARDARREATAQSAELAANIAQGLETVYAATVKCFGQLDTVVMIPWATPPAHVITSTTQREDAAATGQGAAWCTLDSLDGHVACFPVGAAFLRIAALTTIGAHGSQNAGTWATSRPMVRARTAHTLASADHPLLAPDELERQRAAFFTLEAARGDEIRARLIAADPGTGELIAMADKVMTAADYRMEIPFPVNGLPDFSCNSLRSLPFVERPLSLSTSWLVRLPPQQVPPGFVPLPWQKILRGWARRSICASLNRTAERDFECLETGASALRRPDYVCIGPGGGKEIIHADGIGSYNALSIVWELDTETGLYGALDFARPGRTHWVLNMLRQLLGQHDDHQLMSFVMDGVRWGVQAPMQIRIAANLERLDERVRGVGEAFAKLLKKGLYYKYRKLRRAHELIDPNGPGPFVTIPVYIVGTGGTDKPDNPHEKRIVGDQGCPHPEQALRERNEPHGPPDGPLVVSLNDMMGPKPGSMPRGQTLDPLRYPMPDPESKPRPRHSYRNGAVLSHMAHVNKTYVAGFKDDGRHMFFQFEHSPEEERTCAFVVIIPLPLESRDGVPILNDDGSARTELWFTLVIGTCMNMGSRNASKIAQRFTDRILEGFSQLLDVYVRDTWLPKQTPELRTLLAERAAILGPRQARPFDTSGYTDDYKLVFVGPELLAAGARIWRTACRECNYWLSEKACAGTVLDYIGGRLVLNGGFGCVSPSKRARAIADSEAAIGGRLTREQLESHNSFLVHVHEWLDFPMGTLKGLSAPLKLPGSPEQRATLSDHVRAQHRRIVELLQTRQAASFWSGIDEAARLGGAEDGAGFEAIVFAPRITSDACSDVENPHICGVCNGLYFRFPLNGAWRQRHITLTEACGTILALTIFAAYFPHDELLVESDATASLATAAASAVADDLIYIRQRADEIGAFRSATRRAWLLHCKGWANALSDAGSRDKMTAMYALAAAMGIRLREVPIPAEAHAFMQDVLDNTSEAEHGRAAHDTSRGTHNLSMSGDMPIAHPSGGDDRLRQHLEGGLRVVEEPPPLPEGAVGWRACPDCTLPIYPGEGRFCDLCWPVGCGCGCSCQCQCDTAEHASQRRRLESAEQRHHRVDPDLAEHAMLVFRAWLELRRFEWQARLRRIPHFDLNDSDVSDDESPAGGQHSTSRGTHNLSMTGDMPIAQYNMTELLDLLDGALHSDPENTAEVATWSVMVVQRTGSNLIKPSALLAAQAACRFLCRPHLFATPAQAAAASGCPARSCSKWVDKIEACILAETSAEATATTTSGQGPSGQADELPSACSPDEVSAVGSLVSLGSQQPRANVPDSTPPPTFPPSPPSATLSPSATSTPRTPKRTRLSTILTQPVGSAIEEPCDDGELLAQLEAWLDDGEPTTSESSDDCLTVAAWDEFRAAIDSTLVDFTAAHATAMGTHNPSMIGDMPNAQDAAASSPLPLAQATQQPPKAESRPVLGTSPAPLLRRASPRLVSHTAATSTVPSPPLATSDPVRRPPDRSSLAATGSSAPALDEVVDALARRSSPRRPQGQASTETIDLAIAAHPQLRSRSPQPATALEARRRAAHDIAHRLTTHESQYALCPDRPEVLHGIVIDAAEARDAGIPHGTAGADEWGFKWVQRFAEATGNPWMRPRSVHTSTDVLCEVWFAIMALVWIAQMIAPSARRRRAGYQQGMPTSALLALYGWRRVMRDCGRYTPDLTEVRGVLKGICARYKARWGDEAFVPNRKQPFSSRHVLEIVAILTKPVTSLTAWSDVTRMAFLTAFCYALSTGARKDEWTASFEGDTFVRRASFAWVDENGDDLPSSPEVIASRKNGDLLRGKSAPSKCDRLNIEWGGRDMWFRFDDTNPVNFARHWQQWEMAHPCPERERSWWPAFSPTGDNKPFTGSQANALLHAILPKVMTDAEAARRSWHSCRITIATRLYARRGARSNGIAVDAIEGVIQTLVRWKTPEAMRIYARMEAYHYADYVDMATDMRIESDGTAPEDLPEVDPTAVLAENEATLEAIEAEAQRTARAGRTAREDPTAGGSNKRGKRRATPATGEVASGAAAPAAKRALYNIGDCALAHAGEESWGVVGQSVRLHNSFWGWDDGAYSDARVVAYAGAYTFAAGNVSKHTYVVECEGYYYPATHDTVATALTDAATKRRIKKAGLPRLL